jgi:GNAT superfamily N-acetyltransferase
MGKGNWLECYISRRLQFLWSNGIKCCCNPSKLVLWLSQNPSHRFEFQKKMPLDTVTIQKITKEDLHTLIVWAAQEGWNPGKYDVEAFWNTDPDGFYGVKVGDDLIAGGAIVSYEGAFGFMGLFIVHPSYRNQGIGHELWHQRKKFLLARLQKNASIGMDGVVAMQPFYQAGGFAISFRDERYEFVGQPYEPSKNITPITSGDFQSIAAFDARHFGVPRIVFLQQWLKMLESKAFKYIHQETVAGYAVIRKALQGYKIGPLFAQKPTIAEALFEACLNFAGNAAVYLDIPTINEDAVKLVKKYGGQYRFECARMYHGAEPNYLIQNVYGITTFELG